MALPAPHSFIIVVYKDDLSVNSHIETELYYNGFKKNFKLIGTFGRITQI
jgi:hypothetical protein